MILQYNGQEVEVSKVTLDDREVFIESATFVDSGLDLTDLEIDALIESNYNELYEEGFQNAVCKAEYTYEGDR